MSSAPTQKSRKRKYREAAGKNWDDSCNMTPCRPTIPGPDAARNGGCKVTDLFGVDADRLEENKHGDGAEK